MPEGRYRDAALRSSKRILLMRIPLSRCATHAHSPQFSCVDIHTGPDAHDIHTGPDASRFRPQIGSSALLNSRGHFAGNSLSYIDTWSMPAALGEPGPMTSSRLIELAGARKLTSPALVPSCPQMECGRSASARRLAAEGQTGRSASGVGRCFAAAVRFLPGHLRIALRHGFLRWPALSAVALAAATPASPPLPTPPPPSPPPPSPQPQPPSPPLAVDTTSWLLRRPLSPAAALAVAALAVVAPWPTPPSPQPPSPPPPSPPALLPPSSTFRLSE